VRIWDPATGEQRAILQGHTSRINALCAVRVDGRELLASCSSDKTVRIWDPAAKELQAALQGHEGEVNGGCTVRLGGQEMLATASSDGTARIWEPGSSVCRLTIPVYHAALSIASAGKSIIVGLSSGILVISLHDNP
jgi:WD40 repeat protein